MTLASAVATSLVYAAAASAAASLAAHWIERLLGDASPRTRMIAWGGHATALLSPAILIGYAWSNTILSAITEAGAAGHALYCLILAAKLTPVASLVRHLVPRGVSSSGEHCWAIGPVHRKSRLRRLGFWIRSSGRPTAAGLLVTFLLAFGEFEIASLSCLTTWSVWLFNAQIGGLYLGTSLAYAMGPLAVQAIVLAAVMAIVSSGGSLGGGERGTRARGGRLGAWGLLAASVFLTAVYPAAYIAIGAAWSRDVLNYIPTVGRDMLSSALFAVAAVALSVAAAGGVLHAASKSVTRLRSIAAVALATAPGLLGPLLLGLILLAATQLPLANRAADTVAPLALALALLLLPYALILHAMLAYSPLRSARHCVQLAATSPQDAVRARSRAIAWVLSTRVRVAIILVLFTFAYFDLTAGSLLAPAGMTPVFARLYNMMHYGRMAALSAMVLVATVTPLAIAGGAYLIMERLNRLRSHG